MADLLTEERRNELLPDLGVKGWGGVPERDAIRKVYIFGNFVDAWGGWQWWLFTVKSKIIIPNG